MMIIKKYILVLFFMNFGFSQIDLQINLLNTAQYTLSNFNDPTVEQWTVLVTNNYPFPREINLEISDEEYRELTHLHIKQLIEDEINEFESELN